MWGASGTRWKDPNPAWVGEGESEQASQRIDEAGVVSCVGRRESQCQRQDQDHENSVYYAKNLGFILGDRKPQEGLVQ